jgi:hypothetical protein
LALIDSAGRIFDFEPVELGDEYVSFAESLDCQLSIGGEGLFAAWLPSGVAVVGTRLHVAQAIEALRPNLSSFPRFSASSRALISESGAAPQLNNANYASFGTGYIAALQTREDIEDAPRIAVLELSPLADHSYAPDWPEALLASRLVRARWQRISAHIWMAAGATSDQDLAVELFLFETRPARLSSSKRYSFPMERVLQFFGTNWDALCLEAAPANSESYEPEWWQSFHARHFLGTGPDSIYSEGVSQGVWFAVENEQMALRSTDGHYFELPILQWKVRVESLLELVVQSLDIENLDVVSDTRQAMDLWRKRDAFTAPRERLKLYTGIEDGELLDKFVNVDASNSSSLLAHHNELLAAARMRPHRCPPAVLYNLFDLVQAVAPRATDKLDRLSDRVLVDFDQTTVSDEAPHEVGYLLARWLRTILGMSPTDRIEPLALLTEWNVEVRTIELGTNLIDAVGFWGGRFGPGVLINKRGAYSRSKAARRATLAHEICHLLFDRRRSLPLVDILGGRVDAVVEARARAFAAELLIPQELAYSRYLTTDRSIHELSELVSLLCDEFGTSRWIAGFQVKNALVRLDDPTAVGVKAAVRFLDALVGPD